MKEGDEVMCLETIKYKERTLFIKGKHYQILKIFQTAYDSRIRLNMITEEGSKESPPIELFTATRYTKLKRILK